MELQSLIRFRLIPRCDVAPVFVVFPDEICQVGPIWQEATDASTFAKCVRHEQKWEKRR